MVVLIVERVSASLRGELSRWLIEPKTGVFIGRISAMVRDRLWDKVAARKKGGAAMMAHSANNEQGFEIRTTGETSREVVDVEGLLLIRVPSSVEGLGRKGPPSAEVPH